MLDKTESIPCFPMIRCGSRHSLRLIVFNFSPTASSIKEKWQACFPPDLMVAVTNHSAESVARIWRMWIEGYNLTVDADGVTQVPTKVLRWEEGEKRRSRQRRRRDAVLGRWAEVSLGLVDWTTVISVVEDRSVKEKEGEEREEEEMPSAMGWPCAVSQGTQVDSIYIASVLHSTYLQSTSLTAQVLRTRDLTVAMAS